MGSVSLARLVLTALLAICSLPGLVLSDGLNNNEVEFTGTISSLVANGEGIGTVFIRVADFDLRVVVTSRTELSDAEGEDMKMSDLEAGMRIEVTGRYSSSGVLASRIRRIGDADNSFELRGHITAIQASGDNRLVSLNGITVVVEPETKIEEDGAEATAASLKIGMSVKIKGTTAENPWVATSVNILSQTTKKERVRFEGVVADLAQDSMQVAVRGLASNLTTVHLSSNTIITGNLVKDAFVLVIGYLNQDLSVAAREVRVLAALDIKPDERKLKVGETAVFTVKLRETASADVTVALSSSDPSVLSLATTSITVAKGSCVADFSVTALKLGSAVVTAEIPSGQATASVRVGEVSENDNERPMGTIRIAFAPDKIKLRINEVRNVILLIMPPQKAAVAVDFKVTQGLMTVTGTSELGLGASVLKVTIQAGSKEGSDSVVAALPAELGSGKAELLVEISAKNGGTGNQPGVEIAFRPDEMKLPAGETRNVILMLNRGLDKDLTVTLSSTGSGIIEVPATVTVSAGARFVFVSVKGKAAGKSKVTASLPQDLSTDTAELNVEVKS